MQKDRIILFKRRSPYFLYDNHYYLKEDLFTYIKKLKKKNGISLQNQFLDEKGNIIFSLSIYQKGERVKFYVKMYRGEKSIKEFQNLFSENKKKKGKLFPAIAATLLLSLLNPIPLKEDIPASKETIEHEKEEEEDLLDQLFEVYEEKELEPVERQCLKAFSVEDNFYLGKYTLEKVNPYLEAFGFEKSLVPVYQELLKQEKEEYKHIFGVSFFDEEAQNIKIPELVAQIKKNSEEKNQKDAYVLCEVLTEEEIRIVLNQIYNYIEYMKETNEDFDLEHFICVLSDTSFLKRNLYSEKEKKTYATTLSDNVIVWNTFQEDFTSFEVAERITLHEIEHLEELPCVCENGKIYKNGISMILNDFSLYSEVDFTTYDLQPFDFPYLNEYAAENVSSNMAGKEFATYLCNREFVDNLEFSLSINPDYALGTMPLCLVNRKPISFFQTFPYLYSETGELKDYYEMLSCYNLLLDDEKYVKYSLSMMDISEDSFSAKPLLYIAEVEHMKLFYKNLIYLNQRTEENLVEYDLFLIDLFEDSIRYQNKEFFIPLEEVEISFEAMREEFLTYLKEKWNIEEITYKHYTNEERMYFTSYPSTLEEEKKEYIQRKITSLMVSPKKRSSQLIKKKFTKTIE